MEKFGVILCVLLVSYNISAASFEEEPIDAQPNCGIFGYELLVSRMEYIEQNLAQILSQLLGFQQNVENKLAIHKADIIQSSNEVKLIVARSQKNVDSKFADLKIKIASQHSELEQTVRDLQKDVGIKLSNQDSTRGEYEKSFEVVQKSIESKFASQETKINQLNEELKLAYGKLEKADENIVSTFTAFEHAVDRKLDEVFGYFRSIKNRVSSLPFIRSCKDEPTKVTGQYMLQPLHNEKPFVGLCEQDKFGGGWLVIQHRFNGSVDFYRNWTEYKNGFGNLDGEFWLGLGRVHQLTTHRNYDLMVEMETFGGDYWYAMYDGFEIGSEEENFSLKVLGAYSGTAGDSLRKHKGCNFTTYDKDNDAHPANCAAKYKGAWWFNECFRSLLNAEYMNQNNESYNTWSAIPGHFNSKKGLKRMKMMLREKFSLFKY